jgi:uncharacterized protein involved in exopolysaccharide biosynthesis
MGTILCLILTSGSAFLYYAVVGERYEAYTLLRVGQGIKERSGNNLNVPFEGIDLQSRLESLSRLARIDQVIQEAAKSVGYDRLNSEANETLMAGLMAWRKIDLASAFANEPGKAARLLSDGETDIEKYQRSILGLRDRIVAKQEGRSDLLRITFRHGDPSIAAAYLNGVANALVTVHNADVQMPGAREFFQQQTKRLEEEAEAAAANLESFSVKASIYSVDEQRQLLLRRANDLATAISTTRGVIEDKKGQKQAFIDQLQILRPVTQNKTVARMVKTLGGQEPRKPVDNAAKEPEGFDDTPPLLLVKVYQDNMANLMKVNADLNGSIELLQQLGTELENVNKELATLSSKEAEYGRLKRVLTTASTAAAQYATRTVDEEASSEVANKSQLSSLRIVQRAISPTSPVFPQIPQLIVLALTGGILLGFAVIFGPELARGSMQPRQNREVDVREDHLVDSLLAARQRKESARDLHTAGREAY